MRFEKHIQLSIVHCTLSIAQRFMGRRNDRCAISNEWGSGLLGEVSQKLDVALRALDGREGEVFDGEADLFGGPEEILQDLLMDGGVPDDALLPYLVLAGFELRLDEAEDLSLGLQ